MLSLEGLLSLPCICEAFSFFALLWQGRDPGKSLSLTKDMRRFNTYMKPANISSIHQFLLTGMTVSITIYPESHLLRDLLLSLTNSYRMDSEKMLATEVHICSIPAHRPYNLKKSDFLHFTKEETEAQRD